MKAITAWRRSVRSVCPPVLALISILAILNLPSSYSAELTDEENGLAFLNEVVKLDMAKYNVNAEKLLVYPLIGIIDNAVQYTLESTESKLSVLTYFKKGAVILCSASMLQGLPIIAEPAASVLDYAKNAMSRYQAYSKASHIQPMRDMLNEVTELKSVATATERLKFQILTNEENIIQFTWVPTVNGIDVPQNSLRFTFCNETFMEFADFSDCYTIGSADVKISKETAIDIAKKRAAIFSYTIGQTTESNLGIMTEYIIAEVAMANKGKYVLYPYWTIRMPLDKTYYGGVCEIRVLLWADTGEVTDVVAIQTLGTTLEDSTNSTLSPENTETTGPYTSTQPQQECGSNLSVNASLIMAGITVTGIAVVALSALIVKKRKGK